MILLTGKRLDVSQSRFLSIIHMLYDLLLGPSDATYFGVGLAVTLGFRKQPHAHN